MLLTHAIKIIILSNVHTNIPLENLIYMFAVHNRYLLYIGTRIIYDRKFLLLMRNSPLSKTPPAKLASIPDIINEDSDLPPEKPMSPEQPVTRKEGMYISEDIVVALPGLTFYM